MLLLTEIAGQSGTLPDPEEVTLGTLKNAKSIMQIALV